MLLAGFLPPDSAQLAFTLPGGKVEHGEDPYEAVVREVAEETGYQVEVERLLGVDSRPCIYPDGSDLHHVGVFYQVRVTGGELRFETGGTTDEAAWIPVEQVAGLPRSPVVDVGLALAREQPAAGHVSPVPASDLIRY